MKTRINKLIVTTKQGLPLREIRKYPTNPPIYTERCLASGEITKILIGEKIKETKPQKGNKNSLFGKVVNMVKRLISE